MSIDTFEIEDENGSLLEKEATRENPNAREILQDSNSYFRGDIESLRGIAVVAVVIYHIDPSGFTSGFVGVDVFFVISGYVITSMLLRWHASNELDMLRFYSNRLKRLCPAATAVTMGTLVLSIALDSKWAIRRVAQDSIWASLYAANFKFKDDSGDYFMKTLDKSPLLHFWSLAVEEQFYFVLMPILWLCLTQFGSFGTRVFVISLSISSTISIVWASKLVMSDDPADTMTSFFMLSCRWWELCAGCLCAAMEENIDARFQKLISISGMCFLFFSLLFTSDVSFPGIGATPSVVGTSFLILAGKDAYMNKMMASSETLRFLGKISYSIYLCHWPILQYFSSFVMEGRVEGNAGIGLFIRIIVTIGLVSCLSGLIIEPWARNTPSMKGVKNGFYLGGFLLLIAVIFSVVTLSILKNELHQNNDVVPSELDDLVNVIKISVEVTYYNETKPSIYDAPGDAQPHKPGHIGFGNSSSEVVYFMPGDSHASNNVFPGVFEYVVNRQNAYLILSYESQCPFPVSAYGPEQISRAWFPKKCAETREKDWDFIKKAKPQYVITSNSEPEDTEMVRAEYHTAALTLKDIGVKFIVLQDNPHISIPYKDELKRGEQVIMSYRNSTQYKPFLLTPKLPYFVATRQVYCTSANICPIVAGGLLVYRDSNHLTFTYANFIRNALSSLIEEEMNSSGGATLKQWINAK
eukprot:GSChrysophyteH2.ASY1.ANO1.1181.1 assembled CDS